MSSEELHTHEPDQKLDHSSTDTEERIASFDGIRPLSSSSLDDESHQVVLHIDSKPSTPPEDTSRRNGLQPRSHQDSRCELLTDHKQDEQELHNASSLTSSVQSDSSAVRVTITDLDGWENASINQTTVALRKCKQQVLRPYSRLLAFISWRPFGKESITAHKCYWQLINTFYPILIILLLWYTYVYEVVACQWKLNIKVDTEKVPETSLVPAQTIVPIDNATTDLPDLITVTKKNIGAAKNSHNLSHIYVQDDIIQPVCQHIVTTYIIPNLLHFIAFVMGYFYFRIQDNEQLYALMEKVFLQATPLQGRVATQSKIIQKLRLFLAVGALWVILTLGLQVLFVMVFGIDRQGTLINTGVQLLWGLFGVEMIGIMVVNSVNLAVIINYATQCELLRFFIKGLSTRLQEKSVDLKAAMKDILMVRHSIGSLNGPMAQMTSLAAIRFAELTVIGISILILNKDDEVKIWVYRAIFPCVWTIMLLFPLIQAARMNSVCAKFKQLALETRVFGYQNSSTLELDSFLNFVANTRLRAKLFHIPIRPSYLIGTLVIVSFVLLLLFQSSSLGPNSLIF